LLSAPAEAHCYRIWRYPKPQRCFTALAPRHISEKLARGEAGFTSVKEAAPFHERIEISLPPVEFTPCPDGDERMQGIAKLRALEDVSRER
jgi:hypothetical protein